MKAGITVLCEGIILAAGPDQRICVAGVQMLCFAESD